METRVRDTFARAILIPAALVAVSCSRSPSSAARPVASDVLVVSPPDAAEPPARAETSDAAPAVRDDVLTCHETDFMEPAAPDSEDSERRMDHESKKPFPTARRFPSMKLGDAALDRAVRTRLTAHCAAQEQRFYADARQAAAYSSPTSFANDCVCEATYVSPALASVACSGIKNLGGAHPGWSYSGFTFAMVDGKPKELAFADVCGPPPACTKLLRDLLATTETTKRVLDDGELSSKTVAALLARPTFALSATSVRVLLGEEFTGYAGHGASCDVRYAALGPLARLRPATR